MANVIIQLPIPYIGDFSKGRPLFNASIYVGVPELDPEIPANQLQIVGIQENGTEVNLPQPVLTGSGGYPIYNGSPIRLTVDGAYSLKILGKNNNQIYYFANAFQGDPITISVLGVYTDLTFNTVADAISGTLPDGSIVSQSVGQTARTLGYYEAGSGGGAEYIIVAGGTGTDDGGSYINTNNGLQLKLIASRGVTLKQFGAVGNGSTDDVIKIQSAIAFAVSNTSDTTASTVGEAKFCVDLEGCLYGVSSTLYINGPIVFKNGSLVAISLYVASTYIINLQAGAERAEIRSIDLDGGLNGTTRYANLIYLNSTRIVIDNVFGIHFPVYGIFINEGQECKLTNCVIREWGFSEAGTTDGTLRTASAYYIQSADVMLTNCVGAQSLYPLYVDAPLALITGCHFYNGASLTTTEDLSVVCSINASNTVFTGCYFDNGALSIRNNFKQTITGCHFQLTAAGTNTYGIVLTTNTAGEAAEGLSVVGCKFNGSFSSGEFAFIVTGSGSYLDDAFLLLQWVGNLRSDGGAAWYVAKLSNSIILNSGELTLATNSPASNFRAPKNLRLSADYDNNTGPSESEIILATDGLDKWKMTSGGSLIPIQNNTHVIGGGTNTVNNIFTNRVSLIDGVDSPAAVVGFAQLYVDTTDGSLKIIFGDGVIKTIVTDA